MVRSEAEIETELAALRERHAATLEAVAVAEAELVPLDRALDEARLIYDEVGTVMMAAQRAYAGPGHDPYETHWERAPAEYEQARQEARDAESAFHQADEALGRALVVRNTVDGRRGDLFMHSRRIEAAIEQAEAELARTRKAAEPEANLLARIRARVLGEPAGAA